MITCPNCGAGNKPESTACRMCATSLQGIAEAPAARVQPPAPVSTAGATPANHHREEATAPVEQQGIVCSECNTLNEVGWSFCQQCGKRLVQPQPVPPPPAAQPPADIPLGLRTVPDQRAVDQRSAESFKTVVAKPPQFDQGLRTVAETPPPPERDLRTVVAAPPPPADYGLGTTAETPPLAGRDMGTVVATPPPPPVDQGWGTVAETHLPPPPRDLRTVVATPPPPVDQEAKSVREEPRAVEAEIVPEAPVKPPLPPPPAAPPQVLEAPVSAPLPVTRPGVPAAPPRVPAPPEVVEPPKVATPVPPQPRPAGPSTPPGPKPAVLPPPVVAPEPATLLGQAVSGVLCSQCGQSSNVGSAFCASCGAPLTFGKTMVIASPSAPPRGRLHLVMEGGQSGEVYELEEENVIGRSSGKITFPHDGFMSGRHARIELRGTTFILTDEGSRNGTFVKIKEEVELKPGDTILVGKQLFRFEIVE